MSEWIVPDLERHQRQTGCSSPGLPYVQPLSEKRSFLLWWNRCNRWRHIGQCLQSCWLRTFPARFHDLPDWIRFGGPWPRTSKGLTWVGAWWSHLPQPGRVILESRFLENEVSSYLAERVQEFVRWLFLNFDDPGKCCEPGFFRGHSEEFCFSVYSKPSCLQSGHAERQNQAGAQETVAIAGDYLLFSLYDPDGGAVD